MLREQRSHQSHARLPSSPYRIEARYDFVERDQPGGQSTVQGMVDSTAPAHGGEVDNGASDGGDGETGSLGHVLGQEVVELMGARQALEPTCSVANGQHDRTPSEGVETMQSGCGFV